MKQNCNKKEKIKQIYIFKRKKTRKIYKQKNTLTIRNFFKTLKHETKKRNTIK